VARVPLVEVAQPAQDERGDASRPQRRTGPLPLLEQGVGLQPAPRLAQVIVVAVFCCICTVAMLRILYTPIPAWERGLSAVYMVGSLILQLRYLRPRYAAMQGRYQYLLLGAQALLAYLPVLQYGQSWVFMPAFLAGSCLLSLPAAAGWTAFATIVGSIGYIQYLLTGGDPLAIAYSMVSTVITGLVVYGLTRLSGLISELHAARGEIANLAVAQERLRVSRDLHDLLGYGISAIALKSELTQRYLTLAPERAADEVSDIVQLSRRALDDLRTVASAYRAFSLDDEFRSARSVLESAGVEPRMSLQYSEVPSDIVTVLAIIMREGVTNVLRHSNATACEVNLAQYDGRVEICIVNDGVDTGSARRPIVDSGSGTGTGITSLSARVQRHNGTLTAELKPDRRFGLHATIPLPS
jgi:two-component system sensor histidine kinase DesK